MIPIYSSIVLYDVCMKLYLCSLHMKIHAFRMTLEGKLSNNMAPVQSMTLNDCCLVAGSRDRNVRVSD